MFHPSQYDPFYMSQALSAAQQQVESLRRQLSAEIKRKGELALQVTQLKKENTELERIAASRASTGEVILEHAKEVTERAERLEIENESLRAEMAALREEIKIISQSSLVLDGSYIEAGLSIFGKPRLSPTTPEQAEELFAACEL